MNAVSKLSLDIIPKEGNRYGKMILRKGKYDNCQLGDVIIQD